jgi:kynurenine 3-monooxygenase
MTSPSTVHESKPAHSNVLIVGGGPAGLATALMFAKRGWTRITVLEQRRSAAEYEPDKSFNYLIDGRGQKLTDLLELTDAVAKLGVPNTEFQLTRIQPNGLRKTAKLPLLDSTRKTAYWIPRRAFVHLLYETIEQQWKDQITVCFNARCISIESEQNPQRLEVIVQQGDAIERLQPFLLIGCDGIQSIVRQTLSQWDTEHFEIQQFPSPSSRLKYKVLSLPPKFLLDTHHQDHAVATMAYAIRSKWRERRRALSLGLLPIKDDTSPRTANIVTYPDHQIWDLETGEQLLDFLAQAFPQLPVRQIISIEEAERFAKSQGGAFPVPQFCSGLTYLLKQQDLLSAGVLLLGDAIHCFPPDIGQGVNSALEDVFVLNEVLCQCQDDLAQALPQYEAIRAKDVSAVVRLAQIAAPWQYNQNRLQGRLWLVQFLLRLGISRLFPAISPPAFFLLQNHQLSYEEIWNREQQSSQRLKVLSLIVIGGLTAGILVARLRWF